MPESAGGCTTQPPSSFRRRHPPSCLPSSISSLHPLPPLLLLRCLFVLLLFLKSSFFSLCVFPRPHLVFGHSILGRQTHARTSLIAVLLPPFSPLSWSRSPICRQSPPQSNQSPSTSSPFIPRLRSDFFTGAIRALLISAKPPVQRGARACTVCRAAKVQFPRALKDLFSHSPR